MVVVQQYLGMILKRNCNVYRFVVLWVFMKSAQVNVRSICLSHQSSWTAFGHCQAVVIIEFVHMFILSCSSLFWLPKLDVSIHFLLFYLPLSKKKCLTLSCLDITYSVIEFIHAEVSFVMFFFLLLLLFSSY